MIDNGLRIEGEALSRLSGAPARPHHLPVQLQRHRTPVLRRQAQPHPVRHPIAVAGMQDPVDEHGPLASWTRTLVSARTRRMTLASLFCAPKTWPPAKAACCVSAAGAGATAGRGADWD